MTRPEIRIALVVATYGRRMGLRLGDGIECVGRVKGKTIQPVCGDSVEVQPIPGEPEWLITRILPRDNELTRPNLRGKVEVLAANLDGLVVVTADSPSPDWFIVDRYICAAELIDAAVAIVFNKIDTGPVRQASDDALADYARIGYRTLRCSAKDRVNLEPLRLFLANRTAIIVGQSGVGKSSLINVLVGDSARPVAAVSSSSGEGRHTTVNSVLLPLPGGGAVIDSPGVRDYAPAIDNPADVAQGYREIRAAALGCKFSNCRHLQEPACNVKKQVDDGLISERRYESYRRLLFSAERLAERFSR
ncbi:MAG TPA: ribosome small subunit-dependent GTPase A [Woeseiaceae bacterium]|nr:ribosome small subunit-dependent GTPase A [Woeseiaceae bacterium]